MNNQYSNNCKDFDVKTDDSVTAFESKITILNKSHFTILGHGYVPDYCFVK